MKKKLAIFLGLLLFLLPLFSVSSSDEKASNPKKMSFLEGKLYVLSPSEKAIHQYKLSGDRISSFDLKPPLDAVDFTAFQNKLWVIFSDLPFLFVYSSSGAFIQQIPLNPSIMKPTAIEAMGEYLLIADQMGVWVLDAQLQIMQLIAYPGLSDENAYKIESMAWYHHRLYIACSIHQEVYVYSSLSQEGYFTYLASMGGYGSETGRHKKLSGLAVYGKLWLCDSAKAGFEEHHLLTGAVQLRGLDASSSPYADVLVAEKRLYLCSANSDKVYSFPLSQEESPNLAPFFSHENIDFGSISLNDPVQEKLMIYSPDGLPIKGKLSSDHPAVWINPSEFSGSENAISVTLDPGYLKAGMELNAKVLVEFENAQKVSLPVKAKVSSQPDFRVRFPFPPAFSRLDKAPEVTILGQQKLEDEYELINFKESDPFILKKLKKGVFRIHIQGDPDPGFYTLRFQVRSPIIRSVRYFSFNFLYRSPENFLNATVLAEYFAADWCRFCPSGHRAFLELRDLYPRTQLNSLTYYNDCLEETPERLCFSGSEQRMRWYMPQGTHVSLFLNGGDPIHGGINAPDATMLKEYRDAIDPLLKQYTPLSISASLELDPDQRMLDIGATVIQTYPQELNHLRLYAVIAENDIELLVSTGQTQHNFVARQFISLDSSERAAIEGTTLSKSLRNDFHLQARIDDLIDLSQAYVLLFVQDYQSKKVYQTLYLPLKNSSESVVDFDLSSPLMHYFMVTDQPSKLYFELQNTGNVLDRYELTLQREEDFTKEVYLQDLLSQEKGLSLESKEMNPGEKRCFALVLPLGLDKTRSIGLRVRSLRSDKEKELTLSLFDEKKAMDRSRLLFPPPIALESEKGFVCNDDKLNLCWTSCGSVGFDSKEVEEDSFAGVRFHQLKIYPGKRRYLVKLFQKNGDASELELFIHRPLTLKLKINSHLLGKNKEMQMMDVAPFISKENRTMVPLRFIAESFGAQVNYGAQNQTIELIFYNGRITMQVGNKSAIANGKEIFLDSPPIIVNNRTFVPLRAIAELIGAEIYWDAKLQEVLLTL